MAERGIQGRLDEVGEDTVSGSIGAARMFAAVVRDLAKQAVEGIEVVAGEGQQFVPAVDPESLRALRARTLRRMAQATASRTPNGSEPKNTGLSTRQLSSSNQRKYSIR